MTMEISWTDCGMPFEKPKYTYNKKEYTAYLVTANWTYEKDLGYQTSAKLTVINDKDILYIVKGN